MKTKSNDVADALKAEAMSKAIHLGAAKLAEKIGKNVPYLGSMPGVVNRLPGLRGGGRMSGFEFDFLRGLTGAVSLQPGIVEIVVPPASAFLAAGAAFEPVLLRLNPHAQDKVRIVAARKVHLTPAKPSPFGTQPEGGFDRYVDFVEFDAVPITVDKNADGSSVVRTKEAVAAGEYALVLQVPEPKVFRLLETAIAFGVQPSEAK